MASRNYVSHRPKAHAVLNERSQRWQLVPAVAIGNREQQYLKLIAQGLDPAEIARRMRVSLRTANSYGSDLQHKFRVRGYRKLIIVALDLYPRDTQLRERDRSSNRVAATGDDGPGAALSRAL